MARKTRDKVLAEILFTENLKKLRWTLGLLQKDLAERMDTDRPYIADLESGRNSTTLYQLQRVADALGVPPYVLLKPLQKKNRVTR